MSPESFRTKTINGLIYFTRYHNVKCIVFFNTNHVRVIFSYNPNKARVLVKMKQTIESYCYYCNEQYTVEIESGNIVSIIRGSLEKHEVNERIIELNAQ